jgi:hypothetical protein
MNIEQTKAAHKELLRQAEQIVMEAEKEKKLTRMNNNNSERLKIAVYDNLAQDFRESQAAK